MSFLMFPHVHVDLSWQSRHLARHQPCVGYMHRVGVPDHSSYQKSGLGVGHFLPSGLLGDEVGSLRSHCLFLEGDSALNLNLGTD